MPVPKKSTGQGFGFRPEESVHHFLVTIPASNREDVLISEHFIYDENEASSPPTFALGEMEGKLRVMLARPKWNEIADEVRVEFNQRLKKDGLLRGLEDGRQLGFPLARQGTGVAGLGHRGSGPGARPRRRWELAGLVPEERMVAYTMTSAATGHAIQGRNKGWRKAVRYALTENPVTDAPHLAAPIFEVANRRATPSRAGQEETSSAPRPLRMHQLGRSHAVNSWKTTD
ncbi:MAG: DUF3780 domain-containing protein [Chromatiales bacterium]|nr:DUF3780 domain-containing protein [Chromatiales bacterium]